MSREWSRWERPAGEPENMGREPRGVCGRDHRIGAWFGGAIWSVLPELVPGLDPWDAGLVARFGIVLLGSVLLGALPPALRAARAAPASLLSAS